MTLATTINRISYTGNGVTTAFAFPYRFLANADLIVIVRTTATGVEVTKTLTTHYTVSGAGAQAGGTVTMLTAPTALESITIIREPANTQEADFVENDPLPAETLETQLDRAFMAIQRLADKLARSAILTDGNTVAFDPTLPALIVPDTALVFNPTGDGFETGPSITDIADAATNAAAAAASAAAAAASAVAAAASAAAAAAASADALPWDDVVYKTFADSPIAITDANNGTTFAVDTSGGNVVFNLPQVSTLTLANPWAIVIKKASTGDTNSITVNRGGADTIDNVTTKVYSSPGSGGFFVPDDDGTDNWTTLNFVGNDVVTLSDVQTLSNKTILSGFLTSVRVTNYLEMAEVSAPTTPAPGDVRYYTKTDRKLYKKDSAGTEALVGGSGSGSGINYISNPDAEVNTTGYAAYADAAGSVPVNGTGGSPTVTWTRSTSSPLRGSGSFLLTKDAANRQGEGASYDFTIDQADINKNLNLSFDFAVASGTFASGVTSDVQVFVYDITNSQLIYPITQSIQGQVGGFQTTFPTNTSLSYRLILHVATASASAYTLKFDNFNVGPQQVVLGPVISDWQAYTPTFTGFGTPSAVSINWRQVAGSIEIQGFFTTGTTTATEARVSLPLNYAVKTGEVLGIRGQAGNSVGTTNDYSVIAEGSQSYFKFAAYNIGATGPVTEPLDGDDFASTTPISFFVSLPIEGLSSGVVSQNATTFNISSYLANGTRLTGSAPTKLGEYRSYLHVGNTGTYTETSGSPTAAPSSSDGIKVYGGFTYVAGDSANNPSKYEIFIGKGKQYLVQWYQNSGKSGFISPDVMQEVSTSKGSYVQYDSSTGILAVTRTILNGTNYTGGDDTFLNVNDGYFDVAVSEKVIPVQTEAFKSEVYVRNTSMASTNTAIVSYANTELEIGDDISYARSTTNGDEFLINTSGKYAISICHDSGNGNEPVGFSINSTQLSTNLISLATSQIGAFSYTVGVNLPANTASTLNLNRGDIIRSQTVTTAAFGTLASINSFRITRVS